MRTSQALISAIHLVLVFLILGVGAFLVSLPWAPFFCYLFANLLIYSPEILFAGGVFFLLIGLLMLFGFYAIYKQRYLRIKMLPYPFEINPNLLTKYFHEYFLKTFPGKSFQFDVEVLSKQRLEITLLSPPMLADEIEPFLKKIEKEIGKILSHEFSYHKEFVLNLAFNK
jgi:hypothetical protein